jgi:hypothetical protein
MMNIYTEIEKREENIAAITARVNQEIADDFLYGKYDNADAISWEAIEENLFNIRKTILPWGINWPAEADGVARFIKEWHRELKEEMPGGLSPAALRMFVIERQVEMETAKAVKRHEIQLEGEASWNPPYGECGGYIRSITGTRKSGPTRGEYDLEGGFYRDSVLKPGLYLDCRRDRRKNHYDYRLIQVTETAAIMIKKVIGKNGHVEEMWDEIIEALAAQATEATEATEADGKNTKEQAVGKTEINEIRRWVMIMAGKHRKNGMNKSDALKKAWKAWKMGEGGNDPEPAILGK